MTNMTKKELKKKIRDHDNKIWNEDLASKSTLTMYRRYKGKIKEEGIYDNRKASELLFKARTGTLNLNLEKRHKKEDTTCDMCKSGEETATHFILECEKLTNKRDKSIMQKYASQGREEALGEILFREEDTEKVKMMLDGLWRRREVLKKRN